MRVPAWMKKYSIESTGATIRTSSPVSSATSRSAVCLGGLAACGVPLGRVQVTAVALAPTAARQSWNRSPSVRMTMPPDEVAVACLSRATAPAAAARTASRRWRAVPGPREGSDRSDAPGMTRPGRSGPDGAPCGRASQTAVPGRASGARSDAPTPASEGGHRAEAETTLAGTTGGPANRAAGRAADFAAMLCCIGQC